MYGISIDQQPDAPVGKKSTRRALALHWHWTTEYTNKEIATALGVSESTIEKYLKSTPADEIREQLADVETEVRYVAVQELRDQLKAVGHRSRTAESPAKVWTDDDGNLNVQDVTDDDGDVVKRVPVPEDLDLMPDEEARFYARKEVRAILDQLTELLGVGEPKEIKHEHSGEIDTGAAFDEETQTAIRETLADRRGDS